MIWLIGLGGSIGAASRYLLGILINKKSTKFYFFPMATWIINITGSFFLGALAKLYLINQIDDWFWFLFGVGFCGAYTTFSTFGFETMTLIQAKKMLLSVLYIITSVTLGILAAFIGYIFL